MADTEHAQVYLITPPQIDLDIFPNQLSGILDATDVACVRLSLATTDEALLSKTADVLRALTHARDVALVISEHILMVERLGLDGVHLVDGAKSVRKARQELGNDAIVGAYCGNSRHDGITAGEANADYVSFGPTSATALGDGTIAEPDLFSWWSEMIEVPVIAEGSLNEEMIIALSSKTDFFAFGTEIWSTEDPAATLARFVNAIRSSDG